LARTSFYISTILLLSLIVSTPQAQLPPNPDEIGIDEHLGDHVPLDIPFIDENGNEVKLGDLIKRPVIVSLVYYRCPSICKPLLGGVAEVLGKVGMVPGKDYDVITISFDDRDEPEDSRRMKNNYITGIGKPFPEGSWRFLTGDSASIRCFTRAVGFRFRRSGEDFVHPASLIVLGADGKITRYLYGISYLPFDLKMALTEASQGRVGPTIAKVLLYCFSYDSEGKRYVLNVTRVAGATILLTALAFVAFLVLTGRKRRSSSHTDTER